MKIFFNAFFAIAAIILLIIGGTSMLMNKEDRPLHEIIAEDMYNSYAQPRLEYCVEKYGDEFELTEYGSVMSTRFPGLRVYLRWSEDEQTYMDHYIVNLRKEDLESILFPIASEVFGQSKFFVTPYSVCPSYLGKDSTAEALLTAELEGSPLVRIVVFTARSPEQKDEDIRRLAELIQERGYSVYVAIWYLSEENLSTVSHDVDDPVCDRTLDTNFYKYRSYMTITPEGIGWGLDGWEAGNG